MDKQANIGPDRGWSWVIAFSACFSSLVLAGIFRTSGVLFVAFISEFGVTREEAAWPVVLCISVLNLTGIITGPLGLRFGVRPVVITGTLVATFGLSSCYLTTSLNTITFLFGVVFGVGYGLVTTLMPVIVNEYFLNYRATANGIANSGSCLGSIILPPLFEYLIYNYGLSGCFLLTGGIVLHIAITGALMRPPPWLQKTKGIPKVETSNYSNTDCMPTSSANTDSMPTSSTNTDSIPCGYDAVIKSIERRNFRRKVSDENEIRATTHAGKSENINGNSIYHNDHHSYSDRVNDLHHRTISEQKDVNYLKEKNKNLMEENNENIHDKIEKNSSELLRSITDLDESFTNFQSVLNTSMQLSTDCETFDSSDASDVDSLILYYENRASFNQQSKHNQCFSKIGHSTKLKKKLNCEIAENFHNSRDNLQNQISNDKNTPSFHEARENVEFISNTVFTDNTEEEINSIEQKNECTSGTQQIKSSNFPVNIQKSFRRVLTCPMFYVTAMTNVSFYFLYHMYVIIIVDYALDKGVPDKDTKYVLFAFAISDLFGRLCLGWITDRNFLRRPHFVMTCMMLIGLVFFSFPFVNGYAWLIFVSSLYGLLLGCTMVVFPILLVDFLGIEIQAVAMGCMCFLNGLATLTRPFLIGYFRDNIGSYSNIFFVLGSISLLSSFLWLLESCFVKIEKTLIVVETV